ncbi:MAG: SCO family protein [Chitinophagales bacterium]|nr:SCO family protein [Chitinophagales bacterium]
MLSDKGALRVDTLYHVIPTQKFQTQLGDSLSLDSLRGYIYVADFFFTRCAGICPKLSNSMERIQQAFIKDDKVKLLSVSVDPEHDSLPVLRHYASLHNAMPGKWYFLRGPASEVYKLANEGFRLTAQQSGEVVDEEFVHSEKLTLVDWNGNIRGYYAGTDSASVNRLMGDIVLLLRYTEKGFSFKEQKKTSKKLFNN